MSDMPDHRNFKKKSWETNQFMPELYLLEDDAYPKPNEVFETIYVFDNFEHMVTF